MKTLKLFSTLRQLVGSKEMAVPFEEGQTVRQLIETIQEINPALGAEIWDANGELTGLVHILVHGRNIMWLQGLDTTIGADDILVLMPPTAGG